MKETPNFRDAIVQLFTEFALWRHLRLHTKTHEYFQARSNVNFCLEWIYLRKHRFPCRVNIWLCRVIRPTWTRKLQFFFPIFSNFLTLLELTLRLLWEEAMHKQTTATYVLENFIFMFFTSRNSQEKINDITVIPSIICNQRNNQH